MTAPARLAAYLLAISALWGSCFPLIRVLVQALPPFALSASRGAMAALVLLLWLGLRGQLARLDRGAVRQAVVLGTLNGWVPNALVAASLGRIESAPGALIQAAGPLVTLGLSMALLREERPPTGSAAFRLCAGFGMGCLGVLAVMAPLAREGRATLEGGLLMAAAGCSYALGTVYARRARIRASAPVVLGQQLASALPSLVLSLLLEPLAAWRQPAATWGLVAALAVVGSAVPLTLFLRLLSFARARDAALVGYLQPVWAVALAAVLLGERPGLNVLAGGAVVLLGVWLAGWEPAPRRHGVPRTPGAHGTNPCAAPALMLPPPGGSHLMAHADHLDRDAVWKEFAEAVNMTPAALEKRLATEESRSVGWIHEGEGEAVGHQEGRRVVEIRRKKKAELTDDDYAHMRKVVGYVHRHLAQGGPKDGKEHSRWRYSLMNWGHDPLKD